MADACVRTARAVVWVAALVLLARSADGQILTAKVTGGEVRGTQAGDVAAFKGIPFAAPPVGDLRWKAPQPVQPWTGVREADAFGPAPLQPPALAALMGAGKVSEDCLYLNIWTAAKTAHERRPVMVWIYGGAFMMGATSTPRYDGTRLAEKGVVLVSVAYRVGPLGFLAHPQLSAESGKGSGCYGIQDQIAGLRWVKENIAAFGGDPSRVTVFGESAGGFSAGFLAASPAAKGLFHRVICQSGGSMAPVRRSEKDPYAGAAALDVAEARGRRFLAELGVNDIREARRLSADAIQRAKAVPWSAAVDGETIVGDLYDQYENASFNDTPVLIGTNSDDGGMFSPPVATPASFEKTVRGQMGAASDRVLSAYPHATNAQAAVASRQLVRDLLFAWPTWTWAKMQSRHGKGKAYLYYFDYPNSGESGHASEISYVFRNLGGILAPAASPENRAVSERISSYWVNFATNGDPNGADLPTWPAFDERTMTTMILAKTAKAQKTPNLEKLEALDAYFAAVREERR